MPIIQRYTLRLFLKVLLVAFLSLSGLFVVIDCFGNLDEFLELGESHGGVPSLLAQYYGPRILTFFQRTSALMALVAAMFVVTWMQRTNEMTSLMAAGISRSRIIRPLLFGAIMVSLLSAACREFLIPQYRDNLIRNAQSWSGKNARPFQARYDHETQVLFSSGNAAIARRQIDNPVLILPRVLRSFSRQLDAATASYVEPTDDRPGGYLLDEVRHPENLPELPTASIGGQAVILSPSDTAWLEPDQCFLVSNVTFDRLAAGSSARQYWSTPEIWQELRNDAGEYGADVRVALHARMVKPFLDITLLCLGLPIVLSSENRNLFMAAGMCLLLVAGFFLVVIACHALGGSGYLLSPALGAWCPLIIFVPIVIGWSDVLWE